MSMGEILWITSLRLKVTRLIRVAKMTRGSLSAMKHVPSDQKASLELSSLLGRNREKRRGFKLTLLKEVKQLEGKKANEVFQINSHHSKTATAVLCQQVAIGMADLALIQESSIYGGQVRGLMSSRGTMFSIATNGNATSAAFMSEIILMFYLCWSSIPGI
jgi:hypothetical protein